MMMHLKKGRRISDLDSLVEDILEIVTYMRWKGIEKDLPFHVS